MNQTCGCCEGINKITPLSVANRPRLHSLVYRIGTHASFLKTMKAQLSALEYPSRNARVLSGLTTRAGDDPSIALLDAWAIVADVLTFYQERIANEGYLMTAMERRSIAELARLIGYELRPGVAASVYLAYTLEEGYEVKILAGTPAQSIPAPGELPQTFETSEPFTARYRSNYLKPRLTQPIALSLGAIVTDLYFKGTSTGLKLNDPLLLVFGKTQPTRDDFYRVLKVTPDPVNERTHVKIDKWLKESAGGGGQPAPPASGTTASAASDASAHEAAAAAGAANLRATTAEPQNVQEIIDEVRQIIKQYLKLEDFGNPTGQMANNTQTLLNKTASRLNSINTSAKLNDLLNTDVLPKLKDAHATAISRGFSRLEPWIAGMIEEFEAAIEKLNAEEAAASTEQPAEAAGGEAAQPDMARAGIDTAAAAARPSAELPKSSFDPFKLIAVVNALGLPSLIQPSSIAFSEGVNVFPNNPDTAAKLFTVLRPELDTILHKAWGRARVTEPSNLKVYAFRTHASAFGHNAPLMSIFLRKDVIEDWPLTKFQRDLAEPFSITITLIQAPPPTPPVPPPPVPPPAPALQPPDPQPAVGIILPPAQTTSLKVEISLGDQTKEVTKPLPTPPFSINFPERQEVINVTSPDSPTTIDPMKLLFLFTNRQITVRMGKNDSGHPSARSEHSDPTVVTFNSVTANIVQLAGDDSARPTIPPDFSMTVSGSIRVGLAPTEDSKRVSLDATHEQILPGSWVVIERPDPVAGKLELRIRTAEQVREASRADYGMSAKGTQITLNDAWLDLQFDKSLDVIRRTGIFAQSEELPLAEEPIKDPVCGNHIELDGVYGDLEVGQIIAIDGEREVMEGIEGVFASELARIAAIEQSFDRDLPGDTIHTRLILAKESAFCYKRETVRIYGNVVKATHGETKTEVLGSGDGSKSMQQFTLQKSPLTYVSAPNARGIESALEVRVNDVLWHEAANAANLKPTDRSYVIRASDDEKTTITFGNGERGSRLPTGFENVKAVYRTGLGKQGNVGKDQISMLIARPLGVKDVTNPVTATGGAEKESRDEARRNAPLALMALDRLLSVQDYADFTRAFAGIGKAAATSLTDGRKQLVHVTIAGADDIPIDVTSDLFRNLQLALHQFGDPHQAVKVELRELKVIIISAKVRVEQDYLWTLVEPKVREALLDTFSFNNRDLGQDVLLSEVISVIQSVAGVEYVDVDVLDTLGEQDLKQALASTSGLTGLAFKLNWRVVVNTAQAKPLNHKVKAGETMESIMQLYGVTEEQLRVLNSSLAGKAIKDLLPADMPLIIRRIQPAQLALLTRDVRETLILTELTK